jgi:hypothetical protein
MSSWSEYSFCPSLSIPKAVIGIAFSYIVKHKTVLGSSCGSDRQWQCMHVNVFSICDFTNDAGTISHVV